MRREIVVAALTAILASVITLSIYLNFFAPEPTTVKIEHTNGTPAQGALLTVDPDGDVVPLDFTQTSEKVVDAVVHIRSTQNTVQRSQRRGGGADPFDDFFQDFFGPNTSPFGFGPQQRGPQVGTGSGVIISDDGYIVTNNHVIDQADDLEVTLADNRSYKAEVIGVDPTTDLALIKIEEKSLPTLPLIDSDDVKVGEWVLAVGNPFSLNSTVTAGIVSAKGRNINILREEFAVESFIQTDAAINPGNSGGALVNLQGGLIGINTAIASPTGSYSGYGFAVPANIVKKVTEDLLEYGIVQRGVLGVNIRPVDAALVREKNLHVNTGAYIENILESSAAFEGGMEQGDVIIAIDGQDVNTTSDLQELIARRRPGDKVAVKVQRAKRQLDLEIVLNNREGNTELVERKAPNALLDDLGIEVADLDTDLAQELGLKGGAQITELRNGKLARATQINEGFIVTKVDGKTIKDREDFLKALQGKSGGVMLEGRYPDSSGSYYYGFGM